MTMTGVGPGQSVTGFVADASSPFEPVRDGYPPSNPTQGFTFKNESFAGIIHGTPVGGGKQLDLYCIDLSTTTSLGDGYALGTWDAANVPNVGYIARLLQEYYPNTEQPASLATLPEKAAAVQAAIWFFSDRYVLRTSDPVYAATVAIVEQVRAQGPLVQPPPPSLTLTPSELSGPANGVLGPFTVSSGTGQATVTATGANMFSDPAGTVPIADGATVPSGTEIWLRSTAGPAVAALQATATATVPTGSVYLYTGNTKVNHAQSLILAETATLPTTVQATAEFREPAKPSFSIEKLQKIEGEASFTKSKLTGEIGQTVDYEIVVKNTGNTSLKFGALSDANCEGVSPGTEETIAAGGEQTYTCSHKLTATGVYVNEASIEGNEGTGSKTSNKVEVEVSAKPSFSIEKLQKIEGEASFTKSKLTGEIGQTVDYEIVVKNTGNTSLKFGALSDANCEGVSPGTEETIAAGGEQTYTCSHKLTATGVYVNEASIEGNEGTGSKTSNKVEVEVPAKPSFSIEKLQKIEGEASFTKSKLTGEIGQTVDYEIVVKNTGNTSLKFGALSDANCEGVSPGTEETIAAGGEQTYTCSHKLTATGVYVNEASIEGDEGTGSKTSNKVKVEVPAKPSFSIEKLQAIKGSGGGFTTGELTAKLGEVVSYEIVVANTGNTPLKFSPLTDQNCAIISPAGASELAVGGSEVFTCEHMVTSVGTWTNEAEIEAAGEHKLSNKVVVKTPEEPNYEVEKLQLIKGSGATFTKTELSGKIGEVVDYQVIVRNTGNVAIMFAPLIDTDCSSISPSGTTEVPVGGSEVLTCEHTLASSGRWTNEAIVEGAGKTKPSNAVRVNVAAQIPPKGQCAISESASVLHGVSGSKRKTFAVRIPALGIKEITFYLDRRKVKTLKASQASNGEFKINIDPGKLSYGGHRVSVKTVMTDNTCPAIARSAVFVHPRRALVKPRFTG